jgi:hypothetical protein
MTSKTKPGETARLSLKDAFEVEHARREMERRKRDEAERRQQEEDLARAERLFEALTADPGFLASRGLAVDRRRYTVSLDHADYRLAAYFEAGKASITASDKRTVLAGSAAPRKQESVDSVEDALAILAKYLADETR